MAVVVDATGTKLITTVAGASVNYTGITVGSGVNRALVVTVSCAAAVTAPTATWDSGASNQAMSLISVVETQTNVTTFMFALRNPISGNKTLNVAWTTSAKSNVEAISFTGVEQASDARAFILANFAKDGATLNAITMGITPPRDSIVVASYATSATFSSLNQTNLFTDITNTGCEGGATRATGAGASISFTGTDTTTTGNKVMVGFAIISDSAPPTVPWQNPVWPNKKGLAAHLQSFIVAEPVGPPKEDIPKVDRWQQRWEEAPKKRAFGVWEQQTLAWSPLVATASTDVVASDDGSAGPQFRYRLIYRTKTEPVFVPTTTAVTYSPAPQWPDRLAAKPNPLNYCPVTWAFVSPTQPTVWSQPAPWPDLLPTRKRLVADFGTVVPPAQIAVSYAPWPDFAPGRKLPTAEQQFLAFNPLPLTAPVDGWGQRWAEPQKPAARSQQQQALAWTPFIATPAVTTIIGCDFAIPVRSKPSVIQQQTLAWSTFTPVVVVSTDVVASDDGASGPIFRHRLIYRVKTEPVFVPAAPFTYSQLTSWPDIIPTRQRPVTDFRPWSFVPAPAQVFFPYAPWDDFARRKKPPLDTQPLAWSGFTPAPPITWLAQFGVVPNAPRARPYLDDPCNWEAGTWEIPWLTPLSEPVRIRGLAISQLAALCWSAFTPTSTPVDGWVSRFAEVPRRKTFHASQQQSFTFSPFPIPPTPAPSADGWVAAFAQVPNRLAFAAREQQVLAWSTFTPVPFVSTDVVASDDGSSGPIFKYRLIYRVKTEPVFVPVAPVIFFPDRWPDFAQPPKKKPPLNYEPLAFLQVIRSPFNSFVNWPDFATKKRPPLNYEPLTLVQTVRTPWATMTTWPDFARLERKPGLGAPYQQFTARFVGTVTAATITVSMSAFEVNSDTANAVVRVIQSQPAASALVSIEETGILIDPLPGGP